MSVYSSGKVIAILNQKVGVGKTTIKHSYCGRARGRCGGSRHKVLLIDVDPQGSALDWSTERKAVPNFPVIGLPKPTLHREIAVLGQGYEWVVIDGPARVNELSRSAIAASGGRRTMDQQARTC